MELRSDDPRVQYIVQSTAAITEAQRTISDLGERRARALAGLLADGFTAKDISEATGIPRPTVYSWKKHIKP